MAYSQCCTGTGPIPPPNNTAAGCSYAMQKGGKNFWGYDPTWTMQPTCDQGNACLVIKCTASGTLQGTTYSQLCSTPAFVQSMIQTYLSASQATLPTGASLACSGAGRELSFSIVALVMAATLHFAFGSL